MHQDQSIVINDQGEGTGVWLYACTMPLDWFSFQKKPFWIAQPSRLIRVNLTAWIVREFIDH